MSYIVPTTHWIRYHPLPNAYFTGSKFVSEARDGWVIGYVSQGAPIFLKGVYASEDAAKTASEFTPVLPRRREPDVGGLEDVLRFYLMRKNPSLVPIFYRNFNVDSFSFLYAGSNPDIIHLLLKLPQTVETSSNVSIQFPSDRDWVQWHLDLYRTKGLIVLKHLLTLYYATNWSHGGGGRVRPELKWIGNKGCYTVSLRSISNVVWDDLTLDKFGWEMKIPKSKLRLDKQGKLMVDAQCVHRRVLDFTYPEIV